MSHFFKKKLLLIYLIIFILSSFIHYFYFRHAPWVIVSEDTYSYYLAGFQMLNKKIPVHYYRPPIYPFLLHTVMAITGKPLEPILTTPFFERLSYVIILQSIMISLSNVILFITLKKIKVKTFPALVIVLFISNNIIIFSWFRLILTEAFAIFLLSLLGLITVSVLIEPSFYKFIFLLITLLFCVLLRPVYILLPLIPATIFIIYFRKLRVIFYSLSLLLVYFLIIFFYIRINYQVWGIKNISNASYITSFGKVLSYNLNIESAKDDDYFYNKVKHYRALNKELNPFRFMEFYNIPHEQSPLILENMKIFANRVILANLPVFIFKALSEIPPALLDVSEKMILRSTSPTDGPTPENLWAILFQTLASFYKTTQITFFLILFFGPLFIIRLFFRKSLFTTSLAFLSAVSIYQIIFAVFFGYAEYGRLIVPAQPFLYSTIFLCSSLFFPQRLTTALLEAK